MISSRKEFIGKVDYDQSGTISFEEFLYALYLWFADDEVLIEPFFEDKYSG